MENRLVAAGTHWVVDGRGSGCGSKRVTGGIFVVMEILYILTISMSVCWLWYCTLVLQVITTMGNWKRVFRFSLLFLTSRCDYTIISKLKSKNFFKSLKCPITYREFQLCILKHWTHSPDCFYMYDAGFRNGIYLSRL